MKEYTENKFYVICSILDLGVFLYIRNILCYLIEKYTYLNNIYVIKL